MPQAIQIKDHLGLNLAALFDEPASPGPHPLVILLHGYTGWKEERHIETLASELALAGIAAIRFDAPGSGGSEGTWAEHYRVTNYLDDVLDVIAFAKANLSIDPARIAIWGHSLGGMVAILAAIRHPELLLAISGSEPASRDKILKPEQEAELRATGQFTHHSKRFGDIHFPQAFYDDRNSFNVVAEVADLKLPLLLISGDNDTNVSPKSIKRLFEAAPEPKQLKEYPTDHFYKKDPEMLKRITTDTVEFFKDNLLKSSVKV